MKKNNILLVSIFFLFAFFNLNPAALSAPNSSIELKNNTKIDISIDEAINNSTKEVVTPKVEDIKQLMPNSNNEIKKEVVGQTDDFNETIKKFLFAMLGVAVSSVVIFLILTIMNKLAVNRPISIPKKEDIEEKTNEDFVAPESEDEALKVFFEKTR